MHDESCELCGTAREAGLRKAGRRVEMLTSIRHDGYNKIGVFSETEGESEFSYTVGLWRYVAKLAQILPTVWPTLRWVVVTPAIQEPASCGRPAYGWFK